MLLSIFMLGLFKYMAIVLIGGTGTGKSTVGKLISMNIGYKVCEIGHIVKLMFYEEILKEYSTKYKNNIDAKSFTNYYFFSNKKEYFVRKRLKYVSDNVEKNGPDYFVKKILEKENSNKLIIIGVRNINEINSIREKLPASFFVALKCNEDKLTKRFVNREINRMEKQVASNIFEKRRNVENSWGIEDEMEKCDLIINTDYLKPSDISKKIIVEYIKFMSKKKKGIIKNEKRIIH